MVMDIRASIEAELAVSRRIIGSGGEVVPRFVVNAPDGLHIVMVQFPDDMDDRKRRLQVVRNFMVWKAASDFTLASELLSPDAISVIAVSRTKVSGVIQRISRAPLSFGGPEPLSRKTIDDYIVNLLPPKVLAMSTEEITSIQRAFERGIVEGIMWRR